MRRKQRVAQTVRRSLHDQRTPNTACRQDLSVCGTSHGSSDTGMTESTLKVNMLSFETAMPIQPSRAHKCCPSMNFSPCAAQPARLCGRSDADAVARSNRSQRWRVTCTHSCVSTVGSAHTGCVFRVWGGGVRLAVLSKGEACLGGSMPRNGSVLPNTSSYLHRSYSCAAPRRTHSVPRVQPHRSSDVESSDVSLQ